MKTALCISGQMRTYERAYPSIKKHIIDPLAPDIFIHTWSDTGAPIQARQMIPKKVLRLQKYIPFMEIGLIRFAKAYESLSSEFPPDNLVSQEQLNTLYAPKACVVEDFPENGLWSLNGVDVPDILVKRIEQLDAIERPSLIKNRAVVGGLPMFYKMHACNRLCTEYAHEKQTDYDLVIRLRPDLNIHSPIPLNPFPKKNELHFSRIILKENAISDQMAWGSPEAMDFYCAPWEILETLYTEMAKIENLKLFGGDKTEVHHFGRQKTFSVVAHSLHDAILRPTLNPCRKKRALKKVFSI